jgi:hypothetical protein
MHQARAYRVRGLLFVVMAALLGFAASAAAETGKYRLMVRDDPAHSIVIGWCQGDGETPVVHYGPKDEGQNATAYPRRYKPSRAIEYKGLSHRFARIDGLKPDTKYYFVIRDSDSVSRRLWFRTAPADEGSLRFVAGGDSRNHRAARRNANRIVAKLRPDYVLFGGDMTVSGTPGQWQGWLNDWQLTIAEDGRVTPIIAARGNHEPSNAHLVNIFDVPSKRVYYAVTFGDDLLRVYTLNTEISVRGRQTDWLGQDLARHDGVRWKMVQYHKPMWPHTAGKPERDRIYKAWAQHFYDHGVNLVVECDSHMAKRTWPIRPTDSPNGEKGFMRDDERGTVYIGEGCWGAPLRPANDNKQWTRDAGSFNQVKWLRVTPKRITVRTVKVDNAREVGRVSDSSPWQPPENLDLWQPSNGTAIHLEPMTAQPANAKP